MKHWIVTFEDSPEMGRVRADKARRNAHIAFVRANRGLDIGGSLGMTPMQDFPGALWTVAAETRLEVEHLILSDPYYIPSLRRYKITALRGEKEVVAG